MSNDDWFSNVLEDLKAFCEANGLEKTKPLLAVARSTFEAEKAAGKPSELTLEDWWVRENQALH